MKKSEVTFFPFLDLKSYSLKTFKDDILAAFAVALLTIPQSIAYAMLAGLPPIAGLFSAIIASFFVGAFGSSNHMIAGPTTTIAILLQTSIVDVMYNFYPLATAEEQSIIALNILTHIVFLMGFLQILFGLLNMGKILQFVSRSVILGYFAGVVVAIIVNQMPAFLGISISSESQVVIFKLWDLLKHLNEINIPTAVLGLVAILILSLMRKNFPRLPNALIMVVIISSLAYFFNQEYWKIGNLKLHFFSLRDLGIVDFPKITYQFPFLSIDILNKIFPAAIAITLMGILEVFSVARTVAVKSGQNINSNQEIFAMGVGNTLLSFISGAMPASGSISRSLFNYKNKGKTRLVSILSAVFVVLLILFFFRFIQHISLVALSAILIVLVPAFLDYRQMKLCFKVTKGDGIVFSLTMISCLVFSLDIAFFIGIFMSVATFLNKVAVPHIVEYAFNPAGRLVVVSQKENVGRKVRIIGIAGELFFGSVDLFQNILQEIARDPDVRVIVLRFNNVYYMDASICATILQLNDYFKQTNRSLLISGVSEEVWHVFEKAGIIKNLGEENLFLTDEAQPQLSTWHACIRARDIVS
jgi:SulP family sulfate permease